MENYAARGEIGSHDGGSGVADQNWPSWVEEPLAAAKSVRTVKFRPSYARADQFSAALGWQLHCHPLDWRHFAGVAVQLPPQQTSHFEKLIGPASYARRRVHPAHIPQFAGLTATLVGVAVALPPGTDQGWQSNSIQAAYRPASRETVRTRNSLPCVLSHLPAIGRRCMIQQSGFSEETVADGLTQALVWLRWPLFEFCLAGRRSWPQIWNRGAAPRVGLIPGEEKESPLDPKLSAVDRQCVLGVPPESSLRRSRAEFVATPKVTS
jgi:hypothetical protein